MNYGFIREEIQPDNWVSGSGQAGRRFGAQGVMSGGHGWGKYKPEKELQNNGKLETYACTVYGSLNAWETLANFHGFNDFPKNCAERYSAVLAGITPEGGAPHKTCESIREYGVIPNEALPWTNQYTWNDFYSPDPMATEFLSLGKQIVEKYVLGHQWIWNDFEKDKPGKIKAMLERGTVCVSVDAWNKGEDGLYYKDGPDSHWVMLVDYKEGQWWEVWDSYESVKKRLRYDTDFEQAKVYFLAKRSEIPSILERLYKQLTVLILKLWKQ